MFQVVPSQAPLFPHCVVPSLVKMWSTESLNQASTRKFPVPRRLAYIRRASGLFLALISASFSPHFGISCGEAAGFLHASATRMVDGNNQQILLRGVNLG